LRIITTCKTRPGEPRVERAHLKECDIKNIIRRYKQSGEPFPSSLQTEDIDVSKMPSFFEAQLVIARGKAAFYAQPSAIRDRFGNDPAEYVEFLRNPLNDAEAVKMGLKRVRPKAEGEVATAPKESKGGASSTVKTPSGKPDGGQPKGGSKVAAGDSDQ